MMMTIMYYRRLTFLLLLPCLTLGLDDDQRCLEPPAEAGPCKASKIRFSFNVDTGKCEAFVYGGCRGNLNNFRSLKECHRSCKTHLSSQQEAEKQAKDVHVKTPHCLQPPISGRVACRLVAYFEWCLPYYTINLDSSVACVSPGRVH